jgi:anionic cell wall polymer biosynthesis LytR-Cps2A-Psr (LCP) family protein
MSSRRTPLWAVLCTIFGGLLMVGSGSALVAGEWLQARYDVEQRDLFGQLNPGEEYGGDIEGPLNILLTGLDTRRSRPNETPRADAIAVVHVNESLDRAYMISIPRDAIVEIPADPASGYLGGTDRINTAMFHGADPEPGEDGPDVERGFALFARTVSDLTGIEYFDAGVVLRFEGFRDIVDALGGITVRLDERIVSEHRQPDGTHRPVGCGSYCGPQMVYEAGSPPCDEASGNGSFECELAGWHALDVVRQRYGVEGGDYGRAANQQRILRAIMDRAVSRDLVTNPVALDRVLRAAGDNMIFDGRGNEAVDFAFALRNLRSSSMTTIGLPGTSVGIDAGYQGEQLDPVAFELFEALRDGQIDEFVVDHPDLVN